MQRLMVTGGAAGQSGLAYSMHAGKICGTVAAEAVMVKDTSKQSLSRYEQLWRSEFWWEYRAGRACLETLRGMSDEDIDALLRSMHGKIHITERSFYRKAFAIGQALTSARPMVIPAFISNLIEG